MALKGTGFAERDDDWKCVKCGKWHRAKTIACKCGHIPRVRRKRSTYRQTEAKKQYRWDRAYS